MINPTIHSLSRIISLVFEIKSVRTVIDYSDYLNESYLVDLVPMYATSIKKQINIPVDVWLYDREL